LAIFSARARTLSMPPIIPEQAFVMMGGIESVRARAEKMAKES